MIKIILPGEALIDQFKNSDNSIIDKVGGAPLNVTFALSKFKELSPYFVGIIGNDKYANLIEDDFNKYHMSKKYLQNKDVKTTLAKVTLDNDGERSFTFERGADETLEFEDIDFDILVLTSATAMLGGSLGHSYDKYLEKALKQNKLIVFDPNYRNSLYFDTNEFAKKILPYIDKSNIIKLSSEEANIILRYKNLDSNDFSFFKNYSDKLIFITMGSKGVKIILHGRIYQVDSIKVNQIDSTGAGDAFLGYFLGYFISRFFPKSLKEIDSEIVLTIARKASIAAALTTTKTGSISAMPEIIEIEKIK
ncbi:fructokinase/beta-fructofuranosidase [Mycoplasma testudineum]|uniref:Fructokinase/beta-fructofuranosidase n=1 Tax=Mycoplasma testudineum TaxID=244584 RepID=A0A4V3C340_9MOLU|nr:carbohydrate kinase [Mycoplasma testudineum]OYD27011.1 hypothetical protein CG473_01600 [Mycoplasma testudineum]TDO20559.1 fructokinase/beta-fructofuranosidase [Mycoplasma testudineum]